MSLIGLSATAAHAAAPVEQLTASSTPINYLCNGLYQNQFSCTVADWADAAVKAGSLQVSNWSLQRLSGDNPRYLTAGYLAQSPCGRGDAAACADTPCYDNNDSCFLFVVRDAARWYQGSDAPPFGETSLLGVLNHEKLHWAGCGHSNSLLESDGNATPTMVSGTSDANELRTIQQDDINCVKGARLDASRNLLANPGFESSRSEWGGVGHSMWSAGGPGINGPSSGLANRNCNVYAHGGSCVMTLWTGPNPPLGYITGWQVLSDVGEAEMAWHRFRTRSASMWFQLWGMSFVQLIILEGPPPSTQENSRVLANTYCNWNAQGVWFSCSVPPFVSTSGVYTVIFANQYDYGQTVHYDDLSVRLS